MTDGSVHYLDTWFLRYWLLDTFHLTCSCFLFLRKAVLFILWSKLLNCYFCILVRKSHPFNYYDNLLFLIHFLVFKKNLYTHDHKEKTISNQVPNSGLNVLASKCSSAASTQRPSGSPGPPKSCSLATVFHASTNFIIASLWFSFISLLFLNVGL